MLRWPIVTGWCRRSWRHLVGVHSRSARAGNLRRARRQRLRQPRSHVILETVLQLGAHQRPEPRLQAARTYGHSDLDPVPGQISMLTVQSGRLKLLDWTLLDRFGRGGHCRTTDWRNLACYWCTRYSAQRFSNHLVMPATVPCQGLSPPTSLWTELVLVGFSLFPNLFSRVAASWLW